MAAEPGPEGIPPSNVAVFNNIAGSYDTFGPNVQFYNNISTESVGAVAWVVQDNGLLPFINSTAGSITTLEASAACCASPPTSDPLQITGHNNIVDGKGANQRVHRRSVANCLPYDPTTRLDAALRLASKNGGRRRSHSADYRFQPRAVCGAVLEAAR